MIISQTMVAAESADIKVLDVKRHINEVRADIPQFGSGMSFATTTTIEEPTCEFLPAIRSGSFADIRDRDTMEDEHICIDDLSTHLSSRSFSLPSAFYGVFDGHGGSEASLYMKENLTRLFFQDAVFPEMLSTIVDDFFLQELESSHRKAFALADLAMADESIVRASCGTTALTALIIGRHLVVANAGDCRAVLCRRGVAVDMSFDHRSTYEAERRRVEGLGGYFEDGYLNGVLAVTRAIGDWELKSPSSSSSPLISDPEIRQLVLTEEDEFLILACDGIWDVLSSQNAVSNVRQGLRRHGDPRQCAMELGKEAARLNSSDNLTVVVVCFSSVVSSSPQQPQRRRFRLSVSDEARARLQAMLGGD
ncbi:protein phosphatase 2C 13 [Hirschfeldia incana]|nr:protein phosphatase 2C 13 [Hirschfeldia incana]